MCSTAPFHVYDREICLHLIFLSSSNRKYKTFLLLSYLRVVFVPGDYAVIVYQLIHIDRRKAVFVSITTGLSMMCANVREQVHYYPNIAFACLPISPLNCHHYT